MLLERKLCDLQVKGKVNAITIDQCKKTGVVFDSLVASCELVNSSNLQVQVTGVMPTIAIDKCDGVQVGSCFQLSICPAFNNQGLKEDLMLTLPVQQPLLGLTNRLKS